MDKYKVDIAEIRSLASRFTTHDLELCMNQQINEGQNICKSSGHTEEIVNELAKANFVRELVDSGMPLNEAVRELAKRIRAFKQQIDNNE
ncbi:MAG: hypothetical protein N2738_05160 [Thermodesulfovibrionales bacterium]|nr:hypothetical protein [Thermodesulfovibrionales bacterium]